MDTGTIEFQATNRAYTTNQQHHLPWDYSFTVSDSQGDNSVVCVQPYVKAVQTPTMISQAMQ